MSKYCMYFDRKKGECSWGFCRKYGCFMGKSKMPKKQLPKTAGTPSRRQIIFERDGNRCLACGGTESLTLDHIIPKSKGGGNGEDNLQTLCYPCNSKKGNKIKDYRKKISILSTWKTK